MVVLPTSGRATDLLYMDDMQIPCKSFSRLQKKKVINAKIKYYAGKKVGLAAIATTTIKL